MKKAILLITFILVLTGCSNNNTSRKNYIKDIMLNANATFDDYVSVLGGPQEDGDIVIWKDYEIAPNITGELRLDKYSIENNYDYYWMFVNYNPTSNTYNDIRDYYAKIYKENTEINPRSGSYRSHIFNTEIETKDKSRNTNIPTNHETIILFDFGEYIDMQIFFGNSYELMATDAK